MTILLENYMERDPATSTSGKIVFPVRPDRQLLGVSNESDQKESGYDAMALRKIRQDWDRTYLWCLLAELLKHCDLKKKIDYPQYFYETKHMLEKEELSLIFLSPVLIYKALEEAKNKQLMRKAALYMVLLAIDDINFSNEVMKCVGKALKALESSKFRPFFVLFKQLLAIPDGLQAKRLEGVA